MKKKLIAAALAATLGLAAIPNTASAAVRVPVVNGGGGVHTGTVYWILACPAGIITAAMVKNWKRHKELNQQEAWTCGLLYWWNEGAGFYGR